MLNPAAIEVPRAAVGEFRRPAMDIRTFADFWPYYVRAHARARTRILHAIGSVLALVLLGSSFLTTLWMLVAVPIVGYSFAWYAHFFVEHNKPATFGHPFYSLAADYRMLFLMMAGRMDSEVTKYVSVSG
jgi:hypothetical protein